MCVGDYSEEMYERDKSAMVSATASCWAVFPRIHVDTWWTCPRIRDFTRRSISFYSLPLPFNQKLTFSCICLFRDLLEESWERASKISTQ
jgi:hypothetical protein